MRKKERVVCGYAREIYKLNAETQSFFLSKKVMQSNTPHKLSLIFTSEKISASPSLRSISKSHVQHKKSASKNTHSSAKSQYLIGLPLSGLNRVKTCSIL